jgi:hypothetical protein
MSGITSDGWIIVARLIHRDVVEVERRREVQRQHDVALLREIAEAVEKPAVPGRQLEAVAP